MNREEVVHHIHSKTGIDKSDVLSTLEQFFELVKSTVATGEPVCIRTFGTFMAKKRNASTSRNIRKNEPVASPAHFTPMLRPAREFKSAVRKLPVSESSK